MHGLTRSTVEPVTMEALLVWALQVQRADVGSQAAGRVGPADFTGRVSADGAFQCLAQGVLGTRVDCVGSWRLDRGTWLHPDAEAVYLAASALPVPSNFLVLDHARCGTRPDWRPELRPVEAFGELVKRRGQWVGKQHRIAQPAGPQLQYCRIYYRDRRDEIKAARDLWRRWWGGLSDLAGRLDDLQCWTITGIGAPERPWEKKA